jgi:pyruvate kinase
MKLDEIIALSDGNMVARGDLGVELMHEDVPYYSAERNYSQVSYTACIPKSTHVCG